MSMITGLGGVFFHIDGNQKELLEWYHDVLGLEVTEYGINIDSSQATLLTVKRTNNNAYVNFTVDDIESFMKELTKKGVEVVSQIKEYPYGKFSQIKDLYGNIVELFEVNFEAYHKMVIEELENYKNNKR